MRNLSRRTFIGATAAMTAVGFAGLTGCTSKGKSESSESDENEVLVADETIETDILVVGLGISGIMASTAAAKGGAKVLAIDAASKMSETGGGTATAPIAFGSKEQAKANPDVPVTEQMAFQELYPMSHYQENGSLLREMIRCSGICIDTAVEAGMPYTFTNTTVDASAPLKNKAGCIYKVRGEDRTNIWESMLRNAGVDIRFGLSATAALKAEDGTLTGIQCDSGNSIVNVMAKTVILCTGGFISNPEMVSQYYAGANIVSCGRPRAKGDGVIIAQSAGAQMGKNFSTSVNEFGGSNIKATPTTARGAKEECNTALRLQILGLPVFDIRGSRFMDEGILNGHAMYSAEPLIRESTYYALCDQAFIDRIKTEPYGNFIDTSEPTNVANSLADLQLTAIEEDIDSAIEEGWAAKGSTYSELAEAFGLANLEESIEKYNAYCDAGFDEQFYKDPQYLIPMTTAPYYLIEYNPAGYLSLGGIKVNGKCQALDADNHVVKNLYVAGTDADLWSVPYVMGGSAHGFCQASGWLAGESAAKETL